MRGVRMVEPIREVSERLLEHAGSLPGLRGIDAASGLAPLMVGAVWVVWG